MKLTADTITDDQIRELRECSSEYGDGTTLADDYYSAADMLNLCDEALAIFDYGDTFAHLSMAQALTLVQQRWRHARARCAEILNARRSK